MSQLKHHTPSQSGYTLPELLIGMALSLLVIAAATAAYGTCLLYTSPSPRDCS